MVGIGKPKRDSAAPIARRSALRYQRVDIGEIEFQREHVDVEIQHLPLRNEHLQIRERSDGSGLDFILGKRQPAHRLPSQFISYFFREVDFVFDQRALKQKSRRPVSQANQMVVLPAKCGHKIAQLVIPGAGGRPRFDGGQPARKTAVLRTLGQIVGRH